MKKILLLGLMVTSTSFASTDYSDVFYTIDTVEIQQITVDVFNQNVIETVAIEKAASPDPIERVGQIIKIGRDLVALGEEVYTLVDKGRPVVNLEYAPISVMPKVGGEPADIMETENWKGPRQMAYRVIYKNLMGISVIDFQYKVLWAWGGKYNNKGAYISSAQIIPSVHVLWGFDFTARMKLAGIQNAGTRDNPIAVATLVLEHTASNILNSKSASETFVISGNGGFKKL